MLVGMISTLCSRRYVDDGAKAVISIGRPHKFAGGCSGERETSSSTKTIHAVSVVPETTARGHVLITTKRNIDGKIMISRTLTVIIIYDELVARISL